MRNAEQNEILGTFMDLLAGPTGDGGGKRAAGLKPLWKDDDSHLAAADRHRAYYEDGERYDKDSGCHALVHAAWRCLAVAYQDMMEDGLIPENPRDNQIPGQTTLGDFIDDVRSGS